MIEWQGVAPQHMLQCNLKRFDPVVSDASGYVDACRFRQLKLAGLHFENQLPRAYHAQKQCIARVAEKRVRSLRKLGASLIPPKKHVGIEQDSHFNRRSARYQRFSSRSVI